MSRFHKLFGLGLAGLMILALSSLAFTVSLQAATPGDVTVLVSKDANLGDILVDGKGMTLYLFTKDQVNVSNCNGGCAAAWPPLVVAAGQNPTAGDGVTGKLDAITRTDGSRQVTYNGLPLYYFASDSKPGDTNGQGVGGVWFIVHPTDAAAAAQPMEPTAQPASGGGYGGGSGW
jgi:predicted lipoprotein with Yx(FWY)xxD motif